MRNPLAEPGLLGASSGAALGAVLVFYFGLAAADSLILPIGAVVGSMTALATLYALAARRGDFLTIILAGIAINALAAALTSLALNFAPSPYAALEILFWMLGSLADRSLTHVWLAVWLMVPGWILVTASARGLDALTLGEETAASLGFDPRRTQWLVIGGTALAVGTRSGRSRSRRLRRARRAALAAAAGRLSPEPTLDPELFRRRGAHARSRHRDSADAGGTGAQARRRDGAARERLSSCI